MTLLCVLLLTLAGSIYSQSSQAILPTSDSLTNVQTISMQKSEIETITDSVSTHTPKEEVTKNDTLINVSDNIKEEVIQNDSITQENDSLNNQASTEIKEEVTKNDTTNIIPASNDTITQENESMIKETITELPIKLDTLGSIVIESIPDSAAVLINRKHLGLSPISATQLPPETYSIIVLKENYDIFDTTLILASGASDTLRIKLISKVKETVAVIDSSSKAKSTPDTEEAKVLSPEELELQKKKKKRGTLIGVLLFTAFAVFLMASGSAKSPE